MLPFNTIVKIKKTDFIERNVKTLIVQIRPLNLLELETTLSKYTGNFVDHSINNRELIEYCGGFIIPRKNGWIKFTGNEIIQEFGIMSKDDFFENYPEYLI